MKAVTVQPLVAGSVRCEEVPEPDLIDGSILVEAVVDGICGTDVYIASGASGTTRQRSETSASGRTSLSGA